VVRGWVEAVNDGDTASGKPLVADDRWPMLRYWFGEPRRHLENLEIVRVVEGSQTTGTAAEGYRSAASVAVRFDLTGGDGSMPEGATSWGYILARQESSDPWSIVDNGASDTRGKDCGRHRPARPSLLRTRFPVTPN
jgi:hypothetical protein